MKASTSQSESDAQRSAQPQQQQQQQEIYIRQTAPDTYRQVLRDIRQKEIFKLIVDTNAANVKHFFRSVCFAG